MSISDEVLDVAAKAMRDAFERGDGDYEDQARAALEAAAPYLLAEVAKIADERTVEDMDNYFIDQADVGGWLRSLSNPYRSQA